MLTHNKILLFDFETTGLYASQDQIIEIGAILLEKDISGKYRVSDELSTLVLADRRLPAKITEITNITDAMLLRDGVSQEEAFHKFFKMYGDKDTLLIAYNIQFDLSFLTELFRQFKNKTFEVENDILDVMAIYKDRHRFPHRLEQAVATYQVLVPNTHRALDDIKATLEVLKKMGLEKDNISKYINVIGYNAKYGVSGKKLQRVKYIAQRGGLREIEKS